MLSPWHGLGVWGTLLSLTSLLPASDLPATPRVSFVNDVVPVLTKAGCNIGVCHAKAGGGQNGFQLSLLGFEPAEDYDAPGEGGPRPAARSGMPGAEPAAAESVRPDAARRRRAAGDRLCRDTDAFADWIEQGAATSDSDRPETRPLSRSQPRRGIVHAAVRRSS